MITPYILLTNGPRHGIALKDHPAAAAQLRNHALFREYLEKENAELPKFQLCSDYARNIVSLRNLSALRSALVHYSEKQGFVLIDDFRRIFASCALKERKSLYSQIIQYPKAIKDMRTGQYLSEMSRTTLIQILAAQRPIRFSVSKRESTLDVEVRRLQTEQASFVSRAVRGINADKRAAELLAVKDELINSGLKPTLSQIAAAANQKGLTTTRENEWTAQSVQRSLKRLSTKTTEY